MAAHMRAPKQWSLTKQETITSFEAWRQNLQYTLSLDQNFAPFLVDGFTWLKKSPGAPLRGLTDDGEPIPEAQRRTAAQKITQLELMLGQIANFCPVISRNTIVKNSVSVSSIWQSIRLHYGFQSTGAHFIDFNSIKLEPGERPEDLYQRLQSFIEDNLLRSDGSIRHYGEIPTEDEELSPSLENFIVLTWLRLINKDLPSLIKQRYGTELRSKTLASIKPEISQALDSLLEEIASTSEAKVLRAFHSSIKDNPRRSPARSSDVKRPTCPLCQQAGRNKINHFLSKCKFLPAEDKSFMTKVRTVLDVPECDTESDSDNIEEQAVGESSHTHNLRVVSTRLVSTKQSPHFKAFYKQYPVKITLDSGAEISMVKVSVAQHIGAVITKSNQSALQADGITPLAIVGETHIMLSRDNLNLTLDALVVNDLDVDILAGIPFMAVNDISVRPAKQQIMISDNITVHYGTSDSNNQNHVRRAYVLKPETTSVIWPGSYLEVALPSDLQPECTLAIESRSDNVKFPTDWPPPGIIEAISGKVRIPNDTDEPQSLRKNEHFCQVRLTTEVSYDSSDDNIQLPKPHSPPIGTCSDAVSIDPDKMLTESYRSKFHTLVQTYDNVFDSNIQGYNGSMGPFEAKINMGPVQPPQRKGRVPQYARDKLVELQQKFDDLEKQGVFARPESLGITAEYLNPSFLVKKSSGGFRLVTAFADVGRYSKPQPSLMPDVDSTLRNIAQWKYLISSDLTSAFYQIPLSRSSMKYCGVATPFRGTRVYTRCAMGMPGSETALEELMCRVLGDCIQEGIVAKLADDLYCGGNTPDELLCNWKRVLETLQKCNLKLSPSKTIICPRSTTILGWVWTQGKLSASPHRVAVLSKCPPPDTVRGLRSFIGAYKVLSRVLPHCSAHISQLETMVAGGQSQDKLVWSDDLYQRFYNAQKALSTHKSITLPRADDQLWIVTDGSVVKRGIGATLYVSRENKLLLAGFFSAKLRKHQVTWLPCEIEALSIAAAIKHFSPFIIQSTHNTCLLTDSKPCVQAVEKLCRGEFSASPRVTSFLSTVSRYQVNVRHLKGSVNVPSDFGSRNAPECTEPRCQICSFITQLEDSVVRSVHVQDIIDNQTRLPFTTRSAWLAIQSECPDLRRTHAHLKQGTRPSKKTTNVKDVKRYLSVASISRDGMLVVRRNDPLVPSTELIIIPRSVLDGLVTALHIKLDHPSRHQMELVMKRHFYALDLPKAIERTYNSCHTCLSLQKFPDSLVKQASEDPPETIGLSFAADILKRERQLILVMRETVTSYTTACIVHDEKQTTLKEALACLATELHPLDGPPAVIRVDPAPGFMALRNDETLKSLCLSLEIGRVKNPNKNPVAEKAILELEEELLKQESSGGPVSQLNLAIAVARLNSRIRYSGLSAREFWTQRSQFTHEQMPISDRENLIRQHTLRAQNHPSSEKSKHKSKKSATSYNIDVGDLVYLYSDKDKSRARSRYLVVSIDGEWCFIKKFSGNQLRSSSYKVKREECYLVPNDYFPSPHPHIKTDSTDDEDDDIQYTKPPPPPKVVDVPNILIHPVEDTPQPVQENNHNQYDYPVIIASPHEIATDSQPDISTNSPDHTQAQAPVSSRPRREIKPPKYLEDYVLK